MLCDGGMPGQKRDAGTAGQSQDGSVSGQRHGGNSSERRRDADVPEWVYDSFLSGQRYGTGGVFIADYLWICR